MVLVFNIIDIRNIDFFNIGLTSISIFTRNYFVNFNGAIITFNNAAYQAIFYLDTMQSFFQNAINNILFGNEIFCNKNTAKNGNF